MTMAVLSNRNYMKFNTLKPKYKAKFLKEIKDDEEKNLHLNPEKHIYHLKAGS
jgi:hypothetical protein